MPRRPCIEHPCPSLALPGKARCPIHQHQRDQARDLRRGTRQQRGYGATHDKRRTQAITAEPWCHNPTCHHPDADTPANPLSLEHLDPNDRDGPVTVLCHRCNSARIGRH